MMVLVSILFGVSHEGVEARHDLGALSVDEPPEPVARVPLPLVEVLQNTGSPVLLGDPIEKASRHTSMKPN